MSDTPKTDALKPEGSFHHWTTDQLFFHSRALERELNSTTAELERTKEQLRVARECLSMIASNSSDKIASRTANNLLNTFAQSNPDKEEPNVPLE